MKRDLKILSSKFLLLLPIFLISGLFIEVGRNQRIRKCAYCESVQESREIFWSVFGWAQSSESSLEVRETRFFRDYPEYVCEHQWSYREGQHSYFWNSPFIVGPGAERSFTISRSAITARYHRDVHFRKALQKLEEEERVSRELILTVASCHCMCGGRCEIPIGAKGGTSLRDLLDSPEERNRK